MGSVDPVNTAFDSDDIIQGTTQFVCTPNETIDDRVGGLIQAGNNITANYDDAHDPTLQLMQALDHLLPNDPIRSNNSET